MAIKKLFTERRDGGKPRTAEELDAVTRNALLTHVSLLIDQEWFGQRYPYECEDGGHTAGTNRVALKETMAAYHVPWPDGIDRANPPEDGQIFDILEFSYEVIAKPHAYSPHSFFSHDHFSFDQAEGRAEFEAEVNRLFERNGIAFELKAGEVIRLASQILHEPLSTAVFNTGDKDLDELLEAARHKFLSRDASVRKESLEKLWDAWERAKTIEQGKDKKAQTQALLDRGATEPNFRKELEDEAYRLTTIGNSFRIRHSEVGKIPIAESGHIDYLFHRMFALILLLLKASGRLA